MATEQEWEFRIAKLVLEPGDVLVVSSDIKQENLGRASLWLAQIVPPNVEILFKTHDIELSVLTRSQIEAQSKEPGAFLRRLPPMMK